MRARICTHARVKSGFYLYGNAGAAFQGKGSFLNMQTLEAVLVRSKGKKGW